MTEAITVTIDWGLPAEAQLLPDAATSAAIYPGRDACFWTAWNGALAAEAGLSKAFIEVSTSKHGYV
jgi:hypothetical protein